MKHTESEISLINHDLKNNVGAAISYLQLLSLDYPELDDNEYIQAVTAVLVRANELSQDIAVLSHPSENIDESSGLIKLNLKEHIFPLVKASYEDIHIMYPQLTIKLEVIESEDEKIVWANPKTLPQFRENIINNAIKAGATTLVVRHEMKESCFLMTYEDNGKGMTDEEIDNIMLAQHGDGVINGIGTKNILKIAREHNGHIYYSSEVGKGTTIRGVIPYVS